MFDAQHIIENARLNGKPARPAPLWVNLHDSECDVSDAWTEEYDPGNHLNAVVTAFFAHTYSDEGAEVSLCGVSIEGEGGSVIYRTSLELDGGLVERIERAHFCEVNEV